MVDRCTDFVRAGLKVGPASCVLLQVGPEGRQTLCRLAQQVAAHGVDILALFLLVDAGEDTAAHHRLAVDDDGVHHPGVAAHDDAVHRVIAAARIGQLAPIQDGDVGRHAGAQHADVVAAQRAGATRRCHVQDVLRTAGLVAVAQAVEQVTDPHLLHHVRGIAAGGAVHPQPDALDAGVHQGPHRAGAGTQVHIGDRAAGNAGVAVGQKLDVPLVQLDAVGVVEALAQQAVAAEPLHRGAAVARLGVLPLIAALGQVAVHHHIVFLGKFQRCLQDLLSVILRDAGADAHPAHRKTAAVVVGLDQAGGIGDDPLGGIDNLRHHHVAHLRVVAADGVETDAKFGGRLNLGVHQPGRFDRVRVPQVVGGRAPGLQAVAQAGIDPGPRHLRRQVLVDFVHDLEPGLQLEALRHLDVADQRLPGVVVGVDKARRHDLAGGVADLVKPAAAAPALFQVRPHGHDLVAFVDQVGVAVPAVVLVHRDDPVGVADQAISLHNSAPFLSQNQIQDDGGDGGARHAAEQHRRPEGEGRQRVRHHAEADAHRQRCAHDGRLARVQLALPNHVHAGDREAAKSGELHAAGRCPLRAGPAKNKKAVHLREGVRRKDKDEKSARILRSHYTTVQNPVKCNFETSQMLFWGCLPP